MSFKISKVFAGSFDEAILRVTETLKQEGFGILTEIDIQSTLKAKLGVDMPRYRILGACNPPIAHKALMAEPSIGVMLPCNVIVRETDSGMVEIAAINPSEAMNAIGNPALTNLADDVSARLQRALAAA